MNRGTLVALEGIDGCGKSTQLPAVIAALRERGADVVATREPTDGPWGRRIRAMAASGERVPPAEELRWFVEDRRQHVAEVIAPALAAGRCVVSDRYFLSTVAYQGARGLDWREILAASEKEFPVPRLALVFACEPSTGLARVRARGSRAEPAFEEEDFLGRVAAIFAAIHRPWVTRVDASAAPDAVAAACRAAVAGLALRGPGAADS